MPTQKVEDKNFELIKSHCLDPGAEHSPLTSEQKNILERWISAAKILDKYPVKKNAASMLRAKYPKISRSQAYYDINKAIELFNSIHTFDYEWWHSWLLKDIAEHIRACKDNGNLRGWAEGHKNLIKAIGEKPEIPIDPRLTEKNTFIIPVQINNKLINITWDNFLKIPEYIRRQITSQQPQEIDDNQVEKILNS